MASIQVREGKRGKSYRVQYRDQVGHQAVRTFRTLADARAFRTRIEHSRPEDLVAGRITLAEVLEQMRETTSWSRATLLQQETCTRALERSDPEIFSVDVGKLTSARLERAVGAIEAPVVRKRSRVFLNQLLKRTGRPGLPARGIRTRADRMAESSKNDRPLDTAEVEAILAHIPDRYRTMVTLMAYVGLRPGEAYGLQVQDYDPVAKIVTIQRAVSRGRLGPTKTGQTRVLPIGALGDLVAGHIQSAELGELADAQLFTNGQGRIIHENTFVPIFKGAVKAAGIADPVSPNSLRHHAAAWMIHHGANVLQVSRMLGHARPSITLDIYAYLFSDSLDAVAAILPSPSPQPSLESGSESITAG